MLRAADAVVPLKFAAIAAWLSIGAALIAVVNPALYQGVLDETLLVGMLGGDVTSLVVAVLVLGGLRVIRRGRNESWLVVPGLVAYLMYAYSLYTFGLVYTPLYPVYAAIVACAAWSLVLMALRVDHASINRALSPHFPRRTTGAYLLGVVAMFVALWSVLLWQAVRDQSVIPAGVVIAFDLTFALPLLAIVALLLLRRRVTGELLAVPVLVMTAAITGSVGVAECFKPVMGAPIDAAMAAVYFAPAIGAGALAFAGYRALASNNA